ncbi:hypothetical protein [Halomicrobium sp. LC1Hm]|uniref:DUF7331 family protein n=1 Tax=Halomicrobium sp. LC1Hm TaxID=2610902 RepID=UPI0012A9774D|nr:hypothetical protein [Halomicrobium sp. LC1Hm]QGA84091.1 Uncharacterized protein LC1Hm_3065 [Halomicrobium sp. LC1Hm]
MSTRTTNEHDRYPTDGPNAGEYDRYTYVSTGEDVILYDEECEDAWIQTAMTLDLEAWR